MSRPRTELQTFLEELLGSKNVYFQPPESFKLKYPCIIYKLASINSRKANNEKYKTEKCYMLTLIDKDPDSEFVDKLQSIRYCNYDRFYIADNLNHWSFLFYF